MSIRIDATIVCDEKECGAQAPVTLTLGTFGVSPSKLPEGWTNENTAKCPNHPKAARMLDTVG